MSDLTFKEVRVNIPEIATKALKLRTCNGQKRATLSSNWLMLFGFDGTQKVVEESLGKGLGIRVRLANECDRKTKKVYVRHYKSRSANPLNPTKGRKERLIEISSQETLNESLGEDCWYVQVIFKQGVILFQPIQKQEYLLLQKLDADTKINTLVAMTGGVDCHTLERSGFDVKAVISYRPQDARDKTDYTEMDSASVLINSSPNVLMNEDIYKLDTRKLVNFLGKTPITVGHFSITCEDFSTLKNKTDKERAVIDLTSTIDMFVPVLSIVKNLKIPVVVIENVEGFANHAANDILTLQLRRSGFNVFQGIYDSSKFGGRSTRKRLYIVATSLDAPLDLPEEDPAVTANVWEDIVLKYWDEIKERDVTDTKVIADAITTGRARVITKDSKLSPTLCKSQSQDPKDAVIIERDNRYYRLPVSVQKEINSIPSSFNLDWAPIDKAAQIIGQSICCSLHSRIMASVRKHIVEAANLLKHKASGNQFSLCF